MDNVVVTLQYPHRKESKSVDLALPVSIPLFILAPILVQELELSGLFAAGDKAFYTGLVVNSGIVIRPNETLAEAGVVDGDILELNLLDKVVDDKTITEHEPEVPFIKGAFLQSADTSKIFRCRRNYNLVGRTTQCHINLADLPGSSYVSRVHANILARPDGYWIKDENSANGTFVDQHPVTRGGRLRIRHGQRLQFGENGPVLIFHTDH